MHFSHNSLPPGGGTDAGELILTAYKYSTYDANNMYHCYPSPTKQIYGNSPNPKLMLGWGWVGGWVGRGDVVGGDVVGGGKVGGRERRGGEGRLGPWWVGREEGGGREGGTG